MRRTRVHGALTGFESPVADTAALPGIGRDNPREQMRTPEMAEG